MQNTGNRIDHRFTGPLQAETMERGSGFGSGLVRGLCGSWIAAQALASVLWSQQESQQWCLE